MKVKWINDHIVKNQLLTDFKNEYWMQLNVDLETVQEEIDKLNSDNRPIVGEFIKNNREIINDAEIELEYLSHEIKNIRLVDSKIYGDVYFMEGTPDDSTSLAKEASQALRVGESFMALRSFGLQGNKDTPTQIQCIITWDIKLK